MPAIVVLKKPAQKRPASQIEMHRNKQHKVNSRALVVSKRPAMKPLVAEVEHLGESQPRGHYDVMGVRRNATANEIRSSFKALALEKHPDKGGAVDDWNRFWLAWEILKDDASRVSYDAELSASGCQDGIVAGLSCKKEEPRLHHSQSQLGQARKLLEEYLVGDCNHETLLAVLKQWSVGLCSALHELSLGLGTACQTDSVPEVPSARRNKKVHGIYKRADGRYKIYISWRSLDVEAIETASLQKSLDYHLALTSLKQKLMSRQGIGEQHVFAEEFLTVLSAYPHLEFRFTYNKYFDGKHYRLPRFVDVRLAELYSQRLAKANTCKAIQSIVKRARMENDKNREARKDRLACLKDALVGELVRKAKAAEVRANMLQYDLVRKGRKVKEDKALANATLMLKENQFAATLRSQVMQSAQLSQLLNGPQTRQLWPVQEENCCCRIAEFLSFRELHAFQRASYATKCTRDLGVVWIFNDYRYIPGDARIGLVVPRSRGGREVWSGGSRGITAQRIFFKRFLPQQKALLAKHELTCLDFSSAKGEMLEAAEVQDCFNALHGLKQIILPSQGWTSHLQRKHFLQALHPGVNIVFNDGSARSLQRRSKANARAGAKTCPHGHALLQHINDTGDANTCDHCQREIQPPESFFRCNECDFDHCQACYEA